MGKLIALIFSYTDMYLPDVLTKDNLAEWNWHGSKRCVFCHHDETIKHLFFQCRFARTIWSVIQVASTLFPPCSITNIFGNWLNGIDSRFKKHIRVGVIAFIWSLWLYRNDKVFNDKNSSILQVIYSPFMVISKDGGGSRPIYGGLCRFGGHGEGYFFPPWVAA
jgi:hypothetical protein